MSAGIPNTTMMPDACRTKTQEKSLAPSKRTRTIVARTPRATARPHQVAAGGGNANDPNRNKQNIAGAYFQASPWLMAHRINISANRRENIANTPRAHGLNIRSTGFAESPSNGKSLHSRTPKKSSRGRRSRSIELLPIFEVSHALWPFSDKYLLIQAMLEPMDWIRERPDWTEDTWSG